MDISVIKSKHGFEELGFGTLQNLSEGLKKLLFKVIMRKRNILAYEFRGNEIITDLHKFYNEGNNFKFLSPELKFSLPEKNSSDYEARKARAVVDYISGMMDTFALKEWETHCHK
jgi:dGTPase